jgi:hypothetical protein
VAANEKGGTDNAPHTNTTIPNNAPLTTIIKTSRPSTTDSPPTSVCILQSETISRIGMLVSITFAALQNRDQRQLLQVAVSELKCT